MPADDHLGQENSAHDTNQNHYNQGHQAEIANDSLAHKVTKTFGKPTDRLSVGQNEGNTTIDRHGTQGDDERVKIERDDHNAIQRPADKGHGDSNQHAPDCCPGTSIGELVHEHCATNRRYRINRPDGEIDSGRNNHRSYTNGHYGKETGVLCDLRECLCVEKIVYLNERRHFLPRRVFLHSTGHLTVGPLDHLRALNLTAKNRQQDS